MIYAHIHSQSESELARSARLHARRRSGATASLLACLAVVDERRAFLALGYSSMWDYTTRDLLLSEDSAKKFLGAARVGRQFPVVFDMIADRRLSVSTVLTLRAYLDERNAVDLLDAAAGRTREQVEWLIAERFPSTDRFTLECPAAPSPDVSRVVGAPGPVAPSCSPLPSDSTGPVPHSPVLQPLSAERVSLALTIDRTTREKLRRAQELLGHTSVEEIGIVLDRALDVLIHGLEKRKYGRHTRTRREAPPSTASRHIPACIRAEVDARDGGRCTFVSEDGIRCAERSGLHYDHVVPLARGGKTSVANLRLLCAPHNQAEADRVLGVDFMATRRRRVPRARMSETAATPPLPPSHEADLRAALRNLGYRGSEIGVGLDAATHVPHDAALAMRLRAALRALGRGTLEASRRAGARATG